MDELFERLAAYSHDRSWAHWMRYLFSKCKPLITMGDDSGALVIPGDLVRRWQRQANTPYADLPELEKASDREQAEAILGIVESHIKALAAERDLARFDADTNLRVIDYLKADKAALQRESARLRAIVDEGAIYVEAVESLRAQLAQLGRLQAQPTTQTEEGTP